MTSKKPAFPPHVQKAVDEGKLWRAKEILSGRIASSEFSPELYEQYGSILLAMGDELEAGKYLFLSGAGDPDYAHAVDLYLARNRKVEGRQFLASFPARLHKVPFGGLPDRVRRELETRGVSSRLERPAEALRNPLPARVQIQRSLLAFGCLTALLLCALAMLLGFRAMLLWLR